MKGTPPPATVEAFNEDTRSHDSPADESEDEDKLVIDLDPNASMMSNNSDTNSIAAKKAEIKPAKTASAIAASHNSVAELSSPDDSSTHSKEQFPAPNAAKNGEAAAPAQQAKPKGKRGGNKNKTSSAATDNKNSDNNGAGTNSSTTNGSAGNKGGKGDKNTSKSNGSNGDKETSGKTTPAGKPGRKKKEKLPVIKTENSSAAVSDSDPNDPYKFDQSDEKTISSAATGKHGKTKVKSEPVTTKDAQTEYDWRSVSTVTEPENLGPCEPGTQVCLEGIVWQETSNGVLVVNVTWKGKTYMGTLLDATKFDWSPPSCDSPVGDFEGRTPKGRGKRRVPLSDTFKDINERKLRKEQRQKTVQQQQPPPSPAKSDNGKRKGRSSECDTTSEPTPKRGRAASRNSVYTAPPSPPQWECPEPNCGKKYKQMNGLRYHQRNAHQDGSPSPPASESTSETDKPESVSSPEEPPRKSKRKTKAEKAAEKREAKAEAKSEPVELSKDIVIPEKPLDSPPPAVPVTTVTAPVVSIPTEAVKTNTTSVITPTTNTPQVSTATTNTQPPSAVPIATITPQQVVKPTATGEDYSSPSNSSTSNRTMAIAPPPKLISKQPNSMAPLTTITSPGGYNSALKPIQPKPTIMGESTPNPSLQDLMEKKNKRKRSGSKDDLLASIPVNNEINSGKPPTTVHKFETEHRGLLSNGGLINQPAMDPPGGILQSPSYSDISDEGELRRSRDHMTSRSSEPNLYSQTQYPVATVSPQKTLAASNSGGMSSDKDKGKMPMRRQTPSHSPAPMPSHDDKHQKQVIPGLPPQGMPAMPHSWSSMPPEMQQLLMQQHGANSNPHNKDRPQSSRSISPKPQYKPPQSDSRLQFLRENIADSKSSPMVPKQSSSMNDVPHDFSKPAASSRPSAEFLMFQEQQKQREQLEQLERQHKQEMMRSISPATNRTPSMLSSAKHQSESSGRQDRNSIPRSSPAPQSSMHPGLTPFLQVGNPMANAMAAASANPMSNMFLQQYMNMNQSAMLAARGINPAALLGFPGAFQQQLLEQQQQQQAKEGRNAASPSMGSKSSHKIHELENRQSKSPRPSPSASSSKGGPSGHPPSHIPQLYPGLGMGGLFGPNK